MKTSKVGIAAVAILLIAAGIGFGIAQAGVTRSERLSFGLEIMAPLEQGSSSESYTETRPVLTFEDQVPLELEESTSAETQLEGPIETGAFPTEGSEPFWMKEYGND